MRLIVAGGGTGGHLFPGIAVAEEFLSRSPENEVLFVGTERGIESRVLPRLGYRLECIAASGMRGISLADRIRGFRLLLGGCLQSLRILREFKPDLVLGVGGYASGPLVLAACMGSRACFIHEQNSLPGLTNRLLSRFVRKVFVSLEESLRHMPPGKTILTGNPLRRKILDTLGSEPREPGAGGRFHLLVFGGSAGAHRINMAMMEALPALAAFRDRLAITHQTGENDLAEVKAAYRREGMDAETTAFIDDMAGAYGKADLVLCRAGATTIAEVTACGKACIFVPYPYAADDHQRKNAESLTVRGAGFMIPDRELSGERLAGLICELVRNPERIREAGRNAARLARPDAARMIVDEMIEAR